ncbi:hypothetical protein RFI02_16920 [Acinetobacter sichuanensis]|uniref:hypothetical protein n=1 Tax=Acinetobacter sichuanensis TaxID=2136183 RepID=UPI00280FDEDA|nr:hypothetical protein [Acinetobacter sichuanensis]MDQ9022789.1 hypothetical protein [Acinetobacter sichuanensis]
MDILNAKQAFEAMSSGQAVLCRAVGQLLDFGELSQFPATVFFGADYEFCLAPRFMTIGQLDLEVPECIQGFDDLIDAAMYYYAPNLLDVDRPIEILSTADNATYLKRLITSKLLHKTSDDAIAHARAFITLNGGSLDPIEVEAPIVEVTTVVEPEVTTELAPEPVEEKPKKTTSAEVKKRYIEALNKTTREREVFAIETQITINSDLNKRDLNSLKSMIEQLYAKFKQIEAEEINALIVQFKEQITAAQTAQELIKIRTTFASNGTLSDEQHEELNTCFNVKLAEIDSEDSLVSDSKTNNANDSFFGDTEKSRISSEIKQELMYKIFQMSADELDAIVVEIHNNPKLVSTHKNHLDGHIELRRKALVKKANAEAEKKYQELLQNLLNRAAKAQTPIEATVLTTYTKPWTEEQRKPLVDAIHKRLAELDPPAKSESSLMVRINNAQSLEELEILETKIKESDERVQARLFSYANQRRADLVSYEETQNWNDQ